MTAVILVVSLILLIVAVLLFLKRPQVAAGVSADDVLRLKNEADQLKISLAIAEQKAAGIIAEKESITGLLKEEKDRLIDELQSVRTNLDSANQSLESARSYYKSQQEK